MRDQKTTIDYLKFRTQAQVPEALEALRTLFGEMGEWLNLEHLDRGSDGWQQGANVRIADMVVGRVDFGGESQRGWVRWAFPGKGCEWIKNWDGIEAVAALSGAEIRRLDIALTTWHGEVTHEQFLAAHDQGGFDSGGRRPKLRKIVNSDPRDGQTAYVGVRTADKYLRGYEKGREMAGKHPDAINLTHIDGCAVEDIYRVELELKAGGTVIGWDVISLRDHYFAGAYPWLSKLLPGTEGEGFMRRPERAAQTDLAVALENCRVQYGAALFTALAAHGGDLTAVWDLIVGNMHSKPLLASGVLLVDHA